MGLKGELLEAYATRQPKRFGQVDCYRAGSEPCGGGWEADKDGDCLVDGETWELMYGADVRVLIPSGSNKRDVLRMLKKITKAIRKGGIGIYPEQPHTWGDRKGVTSRDIGDIPF